MGDFYTQPLLAHSLWAQFQLCKGDPWKLSFLPRYFSIYEIFWETVGGKYSSGIEATKRRLKKFS